MSRRDLILSGRQLALSPVCIECNKTLTFHHSGQMIHECFAYLSIMTGLAQTMVIQAQNFSSMTYFVIKSALKSRQYAVQSSIFSPFRETLLFSPVK